MHRLNASEWCLAKFLMKVVCRTLARARGAAIETSGPSIRMRLFILLTTLSGTTFSGNVPKKFRAATTTVVFVLRSSITSPVAKIISGGISIRLRPSSPASNDQCHFLHFISLLNISTFFLMILFLLFGVVRQILIH